MQELLWSSKMHEKANPPMPAGRRFCRLMFVRETPCTESNISTARRPIFSFLTSRLLVQSAIHAGSAPGCPRTTVQVPRSLLILDHLLPGSEVCLSLYPAPTCDPELFILLQAFPHKYITLCWGQAVVSLLLLLLLLLLTFPFPPGFLHSYQSVHVAAEGRSVHTASCYQS